MNITGIVKFTEKIPHAQTNLERVAFLDWPKENGPPKYVTRNILLRERVH